jgi:Cu-Zn family superoxide dismutase
VGADGLVMRGSRDLWAIERQGDVGYVVEIRLDRSLTSGEIESRTTDPTFNDPTTAARFGNSLLVVNSQFGERNAGVPPTLPFTVSRVRLP